MNAMASFGGDKFINRLFRRAPGVVWDMMTGKVGFKTQEGIATFSGSGDDAQIEINMFDQFGMEVPAFAQSTPIEAVNVGDLIYFGSGEKAGWIVEKRYGVRPVGSSTPAKRPTRKSTAAGPAGEITVAEDEIDKSNVQFTLMKVDGQRTTWKPPKVTMLGMGADGVMVIRSLLTMLPGGQNDLNGMQNGLMMMMQMSAMSGNEDGPDLEKLMPLMLMSTMSGNSNGGGNMMQMMLMMQMMGGGNNPMANMFGGNKSKTSGGSGPFNR